MAEDSVWFGRPLLGLVLNRMVRPAVRAGRLQREPDSESVLDFLGGRGE